MTFETVENVLNIQTDAIMTLAMAAILLLIGYTVKNKVTFLSKYCIPAPVIGGFIFMFVTFAGYTTKTFTFSFTNTFQDPFMLAFFTTVGLGASLSLLKKGGILLIVYWLCAGVISVFQNLIGIGVGTLVGLEAPYALLSSAIAMIGGHGAAGSYGSTFESLGYSAAMGVGAAAATHTHDNYVPTSRTVNGKALSSDITLSAADVNADAKGSADAALASAKNYADGLWVWAEFE